MGRIILRQNNPYSTGGITAFLEDSQLLLERRKISYQASVDDEYYTIIQGDTLDSISYQKYKDSKFWWVIADANDIENPLDIEVGAVLLIPDLDKLKSLLL